MEPVIVLVNFLKVKGFNHAGPSRVKVTTLPGPGRLGAHGSNIFKQFLSEAYAPQQLKLTEWIGPNQVNIVMILYKIIFNIV